MNTVEVLPTQRVGAIVEAPAENRWLVNSLCAASTVLVLGGAPKSAKTWMGLELAVSIASATACLGCFPVEHAGPVLAYLAEDSLEMARQRVAGICRARAVAFDTLELHLITAPSLRLDVPADLERLDATVEALAPRLLLLDPMVRLHTANENDSRDISLLLHGLRTLQRRHNLTIVLAHHARKNGGSSNGLSLRGSSDIYAWLDTFIHLQRRDDNRFLLQVEHRFDRAPEPLSLRLVSQEDGSSTRLEIDDDSEAPRERRSPIRLADRLIKELRAAPQPLTRTALREQLKVNNARLGDSLEELAEQGRITRSTHGWELQAERSVPANP